MKDYYVIWTTKEGDEGFLILPSYWKLFLWFIRTARRCNDIKIFIA